MVEHFEKPSLEKPVSETKPPLVASSTPQTFLHQRQRSDEDDELLSYDDSDTDFGHENKSNGVSSESQQDGNLYGQRKVDILDIDGNSSTSTTVIKSPSHSFRYSEDAYNFVYSSDDDTTLKQTSPPLVTRKSMEDAQQNDLNMTSFQSFRTTTSTNNNDEQNSFDVVNVQGQSPLIIASMHCSIEVIDIFISKGFDVNVKDMNGSSPLHYICMHESNNEQQICMKMLLENGAYVNFQDYQGKTPLHIAASNNSIANIEMLLSYGACPTIPDYEENLPLHEATKLLNIQAIKLLSRPNVNQELVSEIPHVNEVDEQSDAEIDQSRPAPNSRSLEIWNRFFENAMDVSKTAEYESSLYNGKSSTVVDTTSSTYKATYPLHHSIYTSDTKLIQDLVDWEYQDVNQVDCHRNTPLHVAACKNDLCTMKLLVANGAKMDCDSNLHEQTPLSICLSNGYRECTHFLLDHKHNGVEPRSTSYQEFDVMNMGYIMLFLEYVKIFYNWICQYLTTSTENTRGTVPRSSIPRGLKLKCDAIPEDVATALAIARKQQQLNFNCRPLEPPEDLQIALDQKKTEIVGQSPVCR